MLNRFLLIKKAGLIILIVAVLSVAIIYLQSDAQNRAEKIFSLQAQFAADSKMIDQLSSWESKADKAKQYNQLMGRYLISKDQLLTFSGDMTSLAQRNNLTASVSFGEGGSPSENFRRTNINVSFSGTAQLKDLTNFFSALESSRYFIKDQRIELVFQNNNASGNFGGQVFSF